MDKYFKRLPRSLKKFNNKKVNQTVSNWYKNTNHNTNKKFFQNSIILNTLNVTC